MNFITSVFIIATALDGYEKSDLTTAQGIVLAAACIATGLSYLSPETEK